MHALQASADAALGDDDGPLRARAAQDGVTGLVAATRSLGLLEMLLEKTAGNLGETERDVLWQALRELRGRLAAAEASTGSAPAEGRSSVAVTLPPADGKT